MLMTAVTFPQNQKSSGAILVYVHTPGTPNNFQARQVNIYRIKMGAFLLILSKNLK